MAYHIHEPLGVVGQIIPWNFPILMAAWKLAPALGAGNCVVLKPAESTPISILILVELIADLLPPGVLNIVNGFGREAGMPLATSKRIAKIAFTGSTATGRVIAQAAANNLIPATLELGGKSPNIFFADVMDKDDGFLRQGHRRSGPVRLQPGRSVYLPEPRADPGIDLREVHGKGAEACRRDQAGSPLDTETMMGGQASQIQMDKIESYLKLGKEEGAEVLIGGERAHLGGDIEGGYYISRRCSRATTRCASSRKKSSAGARRDHLQGRSGSLGDRQRHAVRPRRRRLEPQRQRRLPHGSRHPGRPRMDQLLPRLPGPRRLRRLQGIRHRPRDAQGHARPLSADKNLLVSYAEQKLGFF
jgi:hypothetical protein